MARHNLKFWKTFYKIRYYPSITREQTMKEIRFLRKFLPIKRYKNVLDFICGFGRHSIALGRTGYDVEGFDIDKDSIKDAKKIIRKFNLKNIKLYVQDALKFRKRNKFDAVICLYSSSGFLDEKSNERIFENLFQSVKSGGRVILDVMNPAWAIKYLATYSEKEVKYQDKRYLIKHRREIFYNPVRERNVIEFFDIKNYKKYTTSYTLRLYSFEELKEKFQKYNLKIYKNFGSFDQKKISANRQRIIIVADRSWD